MPQREGFMMLYAVCMLVMYDPRPLSGRQCGCERPRGGGAQLQYSASV